MVIEVVLVPKVSNRFSGLASVVLLPTAEFLTPNNNPQIDNFVTLGGTFTLVPALGQFVIFVAIVKATGTFVGFKIFKTDGTTELAVAATVNTGNNFNALYTEPIFIDGTVITVADFVDMKVSMNGTLNNSFTMKQDGLSMFGAEFLNIVNEQGVRRNVETISFLTRARNTTEGIFGKQSTGGALDGTEDLDFKTVALDEVITDFIWSANSGKTLYTWVGDHIGIESV